MTLIKTDIYFEVKDIFGKRVRTSKIYWQKILHIKHTELKLKKSEVIITLERPDEVRVSIKDPFIYLFYRQISKFRFLVVVVKYLNGDGFIVTIYKTLKLQRKGEKLWPK